MKLLKPQSLDLNALIKDTQWYSYLSNTSGILGIGLKQGKALRKLIPEILYFINVIIYTDEAQGDYRTAGFKRIRITDVQHIMSYKKMRQVIHFLLRQNIIEVRDITEFITAKGKQFGINARYFKLIPPYDGKIEIVEIILKTKRKVSVNSKAKQLIETNPVIRHQFEMCSNYKFNADEALIHANNLHDQRAKNDKQWASMLDYIERLRNKSVMFNYNEKTDRVFTIINMCHKELRHFFQVGNGENYESLTELDFSTFNIQVLHKIINDSISIDNINENLLKELDELAHWLQVDFYKKIQDISASVGVSISRDDAKSLALKHWQNARLDSWNEETKIMKKFFPEITKVMNVLKGKTYEDYLKYSNRFMQNESKLVQEIYTEFIAQYPKVCIYNIFDSFLVEEQYKDNLRIVMDNCSRKYFNRQIKIKEKVTNIL
jgi:hypothetical protein